MSPLQRTSQSGSGNSVVVDAAVDSIVVVVVDVEKVVFDVVIL